MSIIKIYKSSFLTYVKIVNFKIYLRRINSLESTVQILGFFEKKETSNQTRFSLLGLTFLKLQRPVSLDEIENTVSFVVENKLQLLSENLNSFWQVKSFHSRFTDLKASFTAKKIVIVAGGPTTEKYVPIKDAFHIAVNNSIQNSRIKFDAALFEEDKGEKSLNFFCNYDSGCIKFLGHKNFLDSRKKRKNTILDLVPESFTKQQNTYVYFLKKYTYEHWTTDLEHEPLPYKQAGVFSALQLACFFGPQTIYLVGCDCSQLSENNDELFSNQFNHKTNWLLFSEFVKRKYPEIEVISINPVGLKGIFNDIYTE